MDIGITDTSGPGPDEPTPRDPSRYAQSPLVAYNSGLETATDLLLMQVSPSVINYELRRQLAFTETQAAVVIHEAAAKLSESDPRSHPSQSGLRPRLPQRRAG